MLGIIAITDEGWYRFCAEHPEVTELNFWTPSAHRSFRAPPFSPFLFQPIDWKPRIQTPVKFDLTIGESRRAWESCLARVAAVQASMPLALSLSVDPVSRYGDPRLVQPRLGQATFRIAVLEA